MAARYVPPVEAASLDNLPRPAGQPLHHQVRTVVGADDAGARVQDRFASRQDLRPGLEGLAFGERRERLWFSSLRRTRSNRVPAARLGENTMVPSSPQAPPRSSVTSHSSADAPPVTAIFLNLKSAENPIHSPSGEKNGLRAPSVPDNGVAWSWFMRRTKSCGFPASPLCATNAIRVPSGDITVAPPNWFAIEFARDSSVLSSALSRSAAADGTDRHGAQTMSATASPSASAPVRTHGRPDVRALTVAADNADASDTPGDGSSIASISMRASPISLRRCVGFFAEAAAHQPSKRRGRRRGKGRPIRFPLENPSDRVRHRVTSKRETAGQHFVEHAPERPDIGPLVGALTARLLGAHVRRCAKKHVFSRLRQIRVARRP